MLLATLAAAVIYAVVLLDAQAPELADRGRHPAGATTYIGWPSRHAPPAQRAAYLLRHLPLISWHIYVAHL